MNNQEEAKRREQMKKQVERSKKYLANNPEARKRKNISGYKSNAKLFINKYADKDNLLKLRELIDNKLKELK